MSGKQPCYNQADLQDYDGEDTDARLREHEVKTWSALLGVSRSKLYDLSAMYLAQGFNKAELSFEFCGV